RFRIPGFEDKNSNEDFDQGSGFCQPYRGVACSQFLQNRSIYVRNEYWQRMMEQKLTAAFSVIATSQDVSLQCIRYAISSRCFCVVPLCDDWSLTPPASRKVCSLSLCKPSFLTAISPSTVCRDECELLESNICHLEYTIAKKHPLIGKADILPACDDLPPIG